MDTIVIEIGSTNKEMSVQREFVVSELSELQLALVGGGSGDPAFV